MNSFDELIIKQNKKMTAEYILKWLEQANQFIRAFLSPADIEKWRKIKNKQFAKNSARKKFNLF